MITHNHQHRHSILMQHLDAARFELARIQQWIDDNGNNPGTATFRRAILAHRLLFDLIASNGGSPQHRSDVMRELTAIHAGERDPERIQCIG